MRRAATLLSVLLICFAPTSAAEETSKASRKVVLASLDGAADWLTLLLTDRFPVGFEGSVGGKTQCLCAFFRGAQNAPSRSKEMIHDNLACPRRVVVY